MYIPSKDAMQTPYILWEYDHEECQKIIQQNAHNPIWKTASSAIPPNSWLKNKSIFIPLDVATASKGFLVECMKVYLIGQNLLILWVLDRKPTKSPGVGSIRCRFSLMWPKELNPYKKYDFMHFVINSGYEDYQDLNMAEEMRVCYVKDEEEFCRHLNFCAADSQYIQELQNLLRQDHKPQIEEKEESPPVPEKKWTRWLPSMPDFSLPQFFSKTT